MAAAIMLPGWRTVLALALAAGLALLFYRCAFRALTHPGLWVFIGLLLVSMTLWVGQSDASLGPLPISLSGLAAGVQMSLRALAITLAVRGLAARVSPGESAGLLERVGVKGLGFTVGVAFNLLPSMERSVRQTLDTARLRGGALWRRPRVLWLAALTVLTSAVRRAEDVAAAAEVRGFSPQHTRPLPLRRGRWDLPLAVALASIVAVFVLL
jgi:energy-coupling factor transporter transmembrane protein EcfT